MGSYLIEFSGLPGSGKSTLSNELLDYLKNEKYEILTEKDIFKKISLISKIFLLIRALFSIKNFKLNCKLLELGIIISIKNKTFYPFVKANKIIRYNNLIWKNYRIKNCIIILSEGNIQYISTLFDSYIYSNDNKVQNLLENFNKIYKNLLYVSCIVNKDVAFKRLLERKSTPNSIDLLEDDKKNKFLDARKETMDGILNNIVISNLISIDMNESIKTNAEILISELVRINII